MVNEYINVLGRLGLGQRFVHGKLADIDANQKLRNIRNVTRIDNIITHSKDRHLIECAFSRDGTIITYEKNTC